LKHSSPNLAPIPTSQTLILGLPRSTKCLTGGGRPKTVPPPVESSPRAPPPSDFFHRGVLYPPCVPAIACHNSALVKLRIAPIAAESRADVTPLISRALVCLFMTARGAEGGGASPTPPPPSRRRLPATSPPPRGSVVGRGHRSVEPPTPLFPPWPRIQWRQLPGSAALVLHSNGDLLPPGFLLPRRHRRGGGPPEKTPSACSTAQAESPTAQAERLIRALNLLPREAGPFWSRDGPPPWCLGSSRSGG